MPIKKVISGMQKFLENSRLKKYNKRIEKTKQTIAIPNPRKNRKRRERRITEIASLTVRAEKILKMSEGKNFINVETETEARKILEKLNVLPTKFTKSTELIKDLTAKITGIERKKKKIINNLFGEKTGQCGLIIIKPEILSNPERVKQLYNFLKRKGYEPIHSIKKILTKEHLLRVWNEPIKKFWAGKTHEDYSFAAMNMLSHPVEVLVFRIPEQEIQLSRKKHITPQEVFSEKRKGAYEKDVSGTIRGEVLSHELKSKGLQRGIKPKEETLKQKLTDNTGYLKAKYKIDGKNFIPQRNLSGVHIPENIEEIIGDAYGLIGLNDLISIEKKIKRNK